MTAREHLRVLRWVDASLALLYFACALTLGWWSLGKASVAIALQDAGEPHDFEAFAFALGCALVALTLAQSGLFVLTAWRIGRARGRWLQTVAVVLLLNAPPLFLAFGVYALWVCWWNPATRAIFDGPSSGDV
ncbi:MAG: hypothetical protein IPJ65_05020 [Archangiaceae bacterium]|nr:hypothetical protein [Archangiaceae bacterium]